MLMLESGDMGEFVGNYMIFELLNWLIDLDVEIVWDEGLLDDPNNKGIFVMELEDLARTDETEMDMDEAKRDLGDPENAVIGAFAGGGSKTVETD
ncbi:hypothetical protein Hdeb2414_s0002g00067651 [Helianthus debilis subsp. tardiflorus]